MSWNGSVTLVLKIDRRPALRDRIRDTYCRVRGLRLTLDQAGRLWGLERSTCRQMFDLLVANGFLELALDSSYLRTERMLRFCGPRVTIR